jgi:hypothetical protein
VQPQVCSQGQWLRDCSQGRRQAQRDSRSSSSDCSGESFAEWHILLYCSPCVRYGLLLVMALQPLYDIVITQFGH